jgi:UDP-glucuronate 4-epimerase
MEKILVTGVAGFIGFHLSKSLLDDGYEVLGVDNLNSYYDPKLKLDRLNILNQYSNFRFNAINIADKESLSDVFTDYNPQKVVNLAAQAGVRYSLTNPYVYMETNMVGFLNILELCRHNEVMGLVYASSSSVYGGNTQMPFKVSDRVDRPISLYAATKRANELIAYSYSHLYGLRTTGLRFFTVYGPWGRPDMAMYIFADKILKGEPIDVFNDGNMKRDFTYIDDIISGTRSAIDCNYQREIFNLGNNKSEQLMEIIRILESKIGKKAIINFQPMQPGDVPESFASISKSKKMLGFMPKTNVDMGIERFVQWYNEYNGIS